jgi:hypothetical protein
VAFLGLGKYPFTPTADANAITIRKQNISNQRSEGCLSAEQFGNLCLEPLNELPLFVRTTEHR